MAIKAKTFDCVDMKHRIQQQLRQEYEDRKAHYTSYADFINKTCDESDEIRAFCRRPKEV
jgi:hypothetical protein